jgi:SAM-dependent methyltransferase
MPVGKGGHTVTCAAKSVGDGASVAGGVLKGERYLEACAELLRDLRGLPIYESVMRGAVEKLGHVDAGYARWLNGLLVYLKQEYGVGDLPILDFGCGMGALTVLMNSLGHRAIGAELQTDHLRTAKLLATENGFDSEQMFVRSAERRLPFSDREFGIVTMFSVLPSSFWHRTAGRFSMITRRCVL